MTTGQYGGGNLGVGPQAWQSRLARANARAGFQHAGRAAGQQALGAARTLGGNNLAAARAGATAASAASARGFGQAAAVNAQMAQQQAQAEQQRQLQERQRGQQMLGGLLGAAGGLVGTMMPGLGSLAGAGAGVLGQAVGGQPQQPSPGARPLGQMQTMAAVDGALGLQQPGAVSEEEWRRRLLGGQ